MASERIHWIEALPWRDPASRRPMQMVVTARDPSGRPLVGALCVDGTRTGYPIVRGIPRVTPELAARHASWLAPLALGPPAGPGAAQTLASVESFGFEWTWNPEARSEEDLAWRICARRGLTARAFEGQTVLDAGCGAGDESRWILRHGGPDRLVSVELSDAIVVAHGKLEDHPAWLGIQADATALPFGSGAFTFVYCEGVLHHTRDSRQAVRELVRVLRPGGLVTASHYCPPASLPGRAVDRLRRALRGRLCHLDRSTILLITGCLATLAHVPVLGGLWGRTVALANPRNRTFRAAWGHTYDAYGAHAYQRQIPAAEFAGYFRDEPGVVILRHDHGDVLARREAKPSAASRGDPVSARPPANDEA